MICRPSRANVKPGDWVMLRNYWVVGPILEPSFSEEKSAWSLQVKVGDYPTGMTVVTREDDPHSDSLRRIMFSGTKEEVLAYAHKCALADRIMEEIIEEENQSISKGARPADCLYMDLIQDVLDGKEWNAETLDTIATIVRESGRCVDDLEQGRLLDPEDIPGLVS